MQTAMAMLMIMGGLGCHHKSCYGPAYPASGIWASHQSYGGYGIGAGCGHGYGCGHLGTAGLGYCGGYSSFYAGYACYDGGYSSGYVACYSSPYVVGCYAPAYPIGAYFGMGTVYAPGPGVDAPLFGVGEITNNASSNANESGAGADLGGTAGAAKAKSESDAKSEAPKTEPEAEKTPDSGSGDETKAAPADGETTATEPPAN